MGDDGVELGLADQRAHVVAPVEGGAEGHRLGARDEPLEEPVVDLVGDEQPLHRHAELAGVRERGADGALGRLLEVGVAEHEDRVLAAELERAADQPVGAPLRDELAGGGRAGEADVVGARDQLGADLGAGTRDDLPEVGREAGLLEQLGREQGRQHGLGVGLGHDGVAGQERREAVAEGHRERVVPGRDDPDDALGDPVELDPGEHREDPADAAGVEVLVRRAPVVARGERDVERLVEGVLAGLARLPADQVDDLLLAVEDEVVQPQQRRGADVDRRTGPLLLGLACPPERLVDVGRAWTAGCGRAAGRRAATAPPRCGRRRRRPGWSGTRHSCGRGRTTRWGRARGRGDPRRPARRRGAGRSCTESMSVATLRLPLSNNLVTEASPSRPPPRWPSPSRPPRRWSSLSRPRARIGHAVTGPTVRPQMRRTRLLDPREDSTLRVCLTPTSSSVGTGRTTWAAPGIWSVVSASTISGSAPRIPGAVVRCARLVRRVQSHRRGLPAREADPGLGSGEAPGPDRRAARGSSWPVADSQAETLDGSEAGLDRLDQRGLDQRGLDPRRLVGRGGHTISGALTRASSASWSVSFCCDWRSASTRRR